MKKNYLGTLFIQAILLMIIASLKLFVSMQKNDLLIVTLYTIIVFVTVLFFYKLSNARKWGYNEMYLFVLFVLVTSGSGLGLMGISNIITDLVLVIVVIVGIIGTYIDSENRPSIKKTKKSTNKKEENEIYVASKNGSIYHRPDCMALNRVKKKDKVTFTSRQEAEKKGYKKCKICLS